ncbi:Mediator complex subunit 15 [Caenorhabditis elegans]|nr:Mediator complex subunit 15 [Caenorhabditis elegans]CDH93001.1 Mediator complex subunit 15 [Caenorhabditis elegans]|eukprot:NP_001294299.1 Uncharacterized protein CELE_C35B1.2 [Caenorhabditis elegans]
MFDDDISPEMREMVENMERKKKINSERLMELLQRIHRIDQICKKEAWLESSAEVQQLTQIAQLLHYCQ